MQFHVSPPRIALVLCKTAWYTPVKPKSGESITRTIEKNRECMLLFAAAEQKIQSRGSLNSDTPPTDCSRPMHLRNLN
jgi:hypothetical protein